MKLKKTSALAVVAVLLAGAGPAKADFDLSEIRLPPGFEIEEYLAGAANARDMAIGENGTLFIGTRTKGTVYAVRDPGGPNQQIIELASRLISPNGVAVRGSSLFVAEIHRILEYQNVEERLGEANPPKIFHDGMPTDRHHGWRAIGFAPDGWLYVAQGAPCNICDTYATIDRIPPQGGEREVWARGVRNSVGLAWHPETGDLWFTENGRDLMGDDIPPANSIMRRVPGCTSGSRSAMGPIFPSRTRSGQAWAIAPSATPPAQELGPHVAPVGLAFYTGDAFPTEYKGRLFIAEHGSWNRSRKIGYRVMMLELEGDKVVSYEPFAEGWLQIEGNDGRGGNDGIGRKCWAGRPTYSCIPTAAFSSATISGCVYRVRYTGN